MPDILDDLEDLYKQAIQNAANYNVASCCERAMAEIRVLRAEKKALCSALWEDRK